MKNVNILTIHKEPNYGALLQAYALYTTIEKLGYKANMINLSLDFRKYPYTSLYKFLVPLNQFFKGYNHCYAKAETFSKEYCPHQIGPFYSFEQLATYPWNKEDTFLIGSDQVWNPEIVGNLSDAFCLNFLSESCKKRYSFSASLGNIKDEEQRKKTLNLKALKKFQKIAVREKFGVEFLKKNNIEAVETIDPTLLIDDYSYLLKCKVVEQNTVFFSSLTDTKEMNDFVSFVAKKLQLSVTKAFGYLRPHRAENKKFLSVSEWLYGIASSKLVITDSFHAMVFAIQFGKPFYIYISEPSKIFRIKNLLDILGIQGRIVTPQTLTDTFEDSYSIDYVNVRNRMDVLRMKSLSYLKEILDESCNL